MNRLVNLTGTNDWTVTFRDVASEKDGGVLGNYSTRSEAEAAMKAIGYTKPPCGNQSCADILAQ